MVVLGSAEANWGLGQWEMVMAGRDEGDCDDSDGVKGEMRG